jgi:hypothetical protein
MDEAVEICKLRLFLKLVAQVEKVEQIEPLPDIDFNIRSGNTLVGFISFEQIYNSQKERLCFDKDHLFRIKEEGCRVARIFEKYRRQQIREGNDDTAYEDKQELRKRLTTLAKELDIYLGGEYGVKTGKQRDFDNWKKSHAPFHWFVEFYGIMAEGGFDVIIGNPPYLESRQVDYRIIALKANDSSAIHAMCIERSLSLLKPNGTISMIVPLALVSTQRMTVVQQMIEENTSTWYANFSWRPGKLFDAVNRALTLFILTRNGKGHTFSTCYQKWNSDTRNNLMPTLRYCQIQRDRPSFWVPKLGCSLEKDILDKLLTIREHMVDFMSNSTHFVYYRTTGGLYWKVFTDFAPEYKCNGKRGHSSRETFFSLSQIEYIKPAIALLSSNLFWWWYTVTSNLRDLNPSDIQGFPVLKRVLEDKEIIALGDKYLCSLKRNATLLTRHQKQTGITETQCFKIQKSKVIIDEIDLVLASHYGFNKVEVDFLVNYDIKYRMSEKNEPERD